jgi:chromosome segregation ATPase
MNKTYVIVIATMGVVIAILLYLGISKFVSRNSYEYLETQNKTLQGKIDNYELANAILINTIKRTTIIIDSLEGDLSESKAVSQKVDREYNNLKTAYKALKEAGQPSDLTVDDVFEICDEVIRGKDDVISTMEKINVEKDKIIQSLNEIVGNDAGIKNHLIEQRNNTQAMYESAISEISEKNKKIKILKIEKYVIKGLSAAGFIYILSR